MNPILKTEVLIVGGGLAGGVTALELADAGIAVTIVMRKPDGLDSNTFHAQGGVVYQGTHDSPKQFYDDIYRAGAEFSNPKAVEILVEEGPPAVRRILLDRLKISFNQEKNQQWSLLKEGGHSIPRILHHVDATGVALMKGLNPVLASHPNITVLSTMTALDLMTTSHHVKNRQSIYETPRCEGVYLFDQKTDQVVRGLAKTVVLATGGLGQIYIQTTNPKGARGDGLSMAYRAGARLVNTEFIQFHPTLFFNPLGDSFLITEAVRGAGGKLVHSDGKPFMEKYDKQWKDLAPRDVVARAIYLEMLEKDQPCVFLDLKSALSPSDILAQFPTLTQRCLKAGIDMTRDLVPVVPAAHYSCGGIWTDLQGKTSIESLYAVGEVACTGLHGANRLASTSLLECVVWGRRAALDIGRTLQEKVYSYNEAIPPWQDSGTKSVDPAFIKQEMNAVKQIMWNSVGLIRTSEGLERAFRRLRQMEIEIEEIYRDAYLSDDLIGLRNGVQSAKVVSLAAWTNKTSVGCHFRRS